MSDDGDPRDGPWETVTPQQWADLTVAGGLLGLLVIPLAKVLVWVKDRLRVDRPPAGSRREAGR